ncbi:MAG TPA: hypothetical protein VIF61_08280, partial [Methylocystis sp.]
MKILAMTLFPQSREFSEDKHGDLPRSRLSALAGRGQREGLGAFPRMSIPATDRAGRFGIVDNIPGPSPQPSP